MSDLKKLPIGIQTFRNIINGNYLYIDKTNIAYELINDYKYIFLSRPRRFGKSLFLDTLKNIFEGNKELFKDLGIYDKWNWEIKYPVINLMLNVEFSMLNEKDITKLISDQILKSAEELNISLDIDDYYPQNPSILLSELITNTYHKYNQQVVLLIDDWDKPIRDNISSENIKRINRILSGLYIVTKDNDEYLKFAFATGIFPIRDSMLFGFNNFTDISLNKKYGNICGFTKEDINSTFNIQHSQLEYYNGYNFLKDPVYNPFDTLQFISNNYLYDNYWFASGTPTYLIKLIKENNYYLPNLLNLTLGKELLDSFDVENIKFEVILYQAGYLTIDKVIEEDMGFTKIIKYKLKVPNIEVKVSLNDFILQYLYNINTQNNKFNTYKSLQTANLDELKQIKEELI